MHSSDYAALFSAIEDAKTSWKARVVQAQQEFRQEKARVKRARLDANKRLGRYSVDLKVESGSVDSLAFSFELYSYEQRGHRRTKSSMALPRFSDRPSTLALDADHAYTPKDLAYTDLSNWVSNLVLHFDDTVLARLRRVRRAIILAERLLAEVRKATGAPLGFKSSLAIQNAKQSVALCDEGDFAHTPSQGYWIDLSKNDPQSRHDDQTWNFARAVEIAVGVLGDYRVALGQLPTMYFDSSVSVIQALDPVRAHGFVGPKLGIRLQGQANRRVLAGFFRIAGASIFDPRTAPKRAHRVHFTSAKYKTDKPSIGASPEERHWEQLAVHIRKDVAGLNTDRWEIAHFLFFEQRLAAPLRHACARLEQFIRLLPEISAIDAMLYKPLPLDELVLDSGRRYLKGDAKSWY